MRFLAVVGLLVLASCSKKENASSAPAPSVSVSAAGEIAPGKPSPQINATAHDGFAVNLAALKGKHVVLYFYPRDETPGCTKEACAFRDAWKELEATGVVLVGISTDSNEAHKKFAEHHQLPFHLVNDLTSNLSTLFSVPNTRGFLARQTIVIGKDGNVKKIYREVDVTKHAEQILADTL